MALTTMDGLTANIIPTPQFFGKVAVTAAGVGIPHTPWYSAGISGVGANPSGGLNGATLSSPVAGQIPVPTPVTGEVSAILRASATQTANVGGIWIVDRMWANVITTVTTTTAQAITSPTWPARDASASTAGVGVYLALECQTSTTNGSPITNTTVSYTNSSGTSGRTATVASWPANAIFGTFVILSLQAGDVGVRSVQSITLGTSYVTGQVGLIAFRYIAELPCPVAATPTPQSFTQLGLPRVWDLSVLQTVYIPTGTAVGATYGSLTYVQG